MDRQQLDTPPRTHGPTYPRTYRSTNDKRKANYLLLEGLREMSWEGGQGVEIGLAMILLTRWRMDG